MFSRLPLGKSAQTSKNNRAYARVVLVGCFVLMAVGFAMPHGARATFTYQETDTAGTTNAFSCDGTTLGSTGRKDLQAIQGGTAGTTGNVISAGSGSNTRISYSLITPANDPNLTSWAAGNWTIRLDVTVGADNFATWDGTCIFRVDSGGTTNLATVGSLTGQAIDLTNAGVKTMTISGSAQTAAATDRVYIEYIFKSSLSGGFTFTSDGTIDIPLPSGGGGGGSAGVQVSSRSDTLSNSQPSATSNHTIAFTIHNSLDTVGWGSGSGGDATDTLSVTFPSMFNLANVKCKDVDISFGGTATSIAGYNTNRSTQQDCPGSATSWGLFINPTASSITFYTPTAVRTYIATGTQVQILIGTNASFQDPATQWITNPASSGTYTISVGGTFGGSGNILVSINSAVTVSAVIAESLSLTISGVASGSCGADDGASVTQFSGVTAVSVPFGTISSNTFYQGCQDLTVSTNAGGGYSLTVQENSVMKTPDGRFTIPDTTCDAGLCSSASSGKWVTATNYGLGHTCLDQTGHDCSGVYASGTRFRPFANVAAGTTSTNPISFIQKNRTNAGVASSNTTAFPAASTPGDLIVAVVNWDNQSVNVSTITDSNGNVYASAVEPTNYSSTYRTQLFYAKNITGSGAPISVTVTMSGPTSNFLDLFILEYAGADSTMPLDATSVGTGTSNNLDSGSKTTSFANELIFGFGGVDAGTAVAGTGFTSRLTLDGNIAEEKIVSSAGSYNAHNSKLGDDDGDFKASPQSGEIIMSSSTPAIATGRVKYRLSVPTSQAAGTYTNLVTYTILGTF